MLSQQQASTAKYYGLISVLMHLPVFTKSLVYVYQSLVFSPPLLSVYLYSASMCCSNKYPEFFPSLVLIVSYTEFCQKPVECPSGQVLNHVPM